MIDSKTKIAFELEKSMQEMRTAYNAGEYDNCNLYSYGIDDAKNIVRRVFEENGFDEGLASVQEIFDGYKEDYCYKRDEDCDSDYYDGFYEVLKDTKEKYGLSVEFETTLGFSCYEFNVDNEYYFEEEGLEMFDDILSEYANGDLTFDNIKSYICVKIDTNYEECFNRTDFLADIIKNKEEEFTDYNDVVEDSDCIFYLYAQYNNEIGNFELRMVEDYIGDKEVPLSESEQVILNETIKSYSEKLINGYVEKCEKESKNSLKKSEKLDETR